MFTPFWTPVHSHASVLHVLIMTISQFMQSFRKLKNFPFARFFRPNISIFALLFFVKKFANIIQLFPETATFLSGRMKLLLSYKCFLRKLWWKLNILVKMYAKTNISQKSTKISCHQNIFKKSPFFTCCWHVSSHLVKSQPVAQEKQVRCLACVPMLPPGFQIQAPFSLFAFIFSSVSTFGFPPF